ncbi:kelch-like protein 2 isoform X2 [Cephus cinctus]|uniref:Kelch-like protein 2 isoform X2 n=1 Tax=Cephus cinctus TaxID=211228 RepID=A0AAJ7BVZ4_CEPCN|nr:kelch-like protein 2 isoform X2 [Cephus cinctus]
MDETDQNENLNMNNKGNNQEKNGSWPQLHSLVEHSFDPSFDRYVTRHNGEEIPIYRSSHLANRAFDIINEMQKDVIQYEEFLSLPAQTLLKLISNDRLAVPSEEIVFDSVILWINHDKEKREECLTLLIEQVRLPLMSHKYLLERVWEEKMIKASSQFQDYLIEALKYQLFKEAGESLFETSRTKSRVPHELPKLLVVVGGSLPKAAKSVECFDFRTKKWYPLADLPTEFIRGGIALFEDKIYTVGGCTLNKTPLTKMNVYDPATDQWSAGKEMRIKRTDLGVALLDNAIYAIGGMNPSVFNNSCDAFDPKTQKWNGITPMPKICTGFAVAVLNGLLYVVGGYCSERRCHLSSVLCYDYETGKWNSINDTNFNRYNAGAGVLNGTLYVVGGQNGGGVLKSVEAFDPQTKKWQQVKDMPEGREHVAVVGFGKHLYVVGGNDGEKYFTSVNVYCPKSDTWEVLSSSMSIERGSTSVAIINKPYNYI